MPLTKEQQKQYIQLAFKLQGHSPSDPRYKRWMQEELAVFEDKARGGLGGRQWLEQRKDMPEVASLLQSFQPAPVASTVEPAPDVSIAATREPLKATYLGGAGVPLTEITGTSVADIEAQATAKGINPVNLYGEGFKQGALPAEELPRIEAVKVGEPLPPPPVKAVFLGDKDIVEQTIAGGSVAEVEAKAVAKGINPVNLFGPGFQKGVPDIPQLTGVFEPTTGEELDVTLPDITPPTAPAIIETYTTSILADLETKRAALDKIYSQQLADLRQRSTDLETKISDLTTKQEGVLGDVKTLTEPFREQLEKSERERLKVEEMYFANQKTLKELETLSTTAQAEIEAMRAVTGLTAIRSPRIAKFEEDIAARVGVLESVMAIRDGQITVAQTMIDRSIEAIRADRQDRLAYYENLFKFYEKQKDAEGQKLITLKKDEKEFLKAQIGLIEADLETSQENAEYIKDLMIDPETADIIEQSGVKLTDSPEQVSQKFADWGYRQEVIELNNQMETQGWQYIPDEAMLAGKDRTNLYYHTDSRGRSRVYWRPPEAEEVAGVAGGAGIPEPPVGVSPFGKEITDIWNEVFEAGETVDDFISKAKDRGLDDIDIIGVLDENTKLNRTQIKDMVERRADVGTMADAFIKQNYDKSIFKSRESELKQAKGDAIKQIQTIPDNTEEGGLKFTSEYKQKLIDNINAITETKEEAERILAIEIE